MAYLTTYPISMVKVLLNRIRRTRREFDRLLKERPLVVVTPKKLKALDKKMQRVFDRAEELEKLVSRKKTIKKKK